MEIKEKQRKLVALLSKRGMDDEQRHELVYHFTSGRTKSTKDLSEQELNQLFSNLLKDNSYTDKTQHEIDAELRSKRSIILSIATRVGLHDVNNWSQFNSFMLKKSLLKKALKEHTTPELDDLIKQFRAIERNYNKSAERMGTVAHNHKYKMPKIFIN